MDTAVHGALLGVFVIFPSAVYPSTDRDSRACLTTCLAFTTAGVCTHAHRYSNDSLTHELDPPNPTVDTVARIIDCVPNDVNKKQNT